MKRILTLLLAFCLLATLPMTAFAAEKDMSFSFELTVDGKDSKQVEPGDIITVVVKLKREDSSEAFPMYAMQDEIRYDSQFFELVDGSVILNQGVTSTDIAMVDRYRELYMNFLSMSGGTRWNADTMVGSFQLRVIGTNGATQITNQDYLVSSQDGSYTYECTAQDVTIVLSSDCIVTFHTNGGTALENVVVEYGALLTMPDAPIKDGYHLEGWYKDIHLTQKWDFEKDTVDGNLTLYAKWAEGESEMPVDQNNLGIIVLIVVLFLILVLVAVILLKKKFANRYKGKHER